MLNNEDLQKAFGRHIDLPVGKWQRKARRPDIASSSHRHPVWQVLLMVWFEENAKIVLFLLNRGVKATT
jgi:hypothetical protein